MFTIPADFQIGTEHPIFKGLGGSVVAYHTRSDTQPTQVLFTKATLIYIQHGAKHFRKHLEAEYAQVQAGSVVLMSSGCRLMSEFVNERGVYKSTVICFEADFLAKTLPELVGKAALEPPEYVVNPDTSVLKVVAEFSERLKTHPGERILQLRLQELVLALAQADPLAESILVHAIKEGHGASTSRIQHVMKQHFHEPLQLADYAGLCGRSLSSFKRDFKRIFGLAPGSWLNKERLSYAARLLEEDALNITEVCMECGYGHLSNFIRAFQKKYRVSPKQYQLRAREHRFNIRMS